MDLSAASKADERAMRLTRAGMIICFIVASAMLITSLAMANGTHTSHAALLPAPASTTR